jgi:hypothetical protein
MNRYLSILIEAIVVGLITIIVGYIAGYIIHNIYPTDFLPNICKTWNKYNVMEKTLFLTGFLIHLICEFAGINKWYCINGAACM